MTWPKMVCRLSSHGVGNGGYKELASVGIGAALAMASFPAYQTSDPH